MLWVYPRLKKWDVGITINGFLGGLVAITAPCYWVNATGAVIIGAIAGPIVVLVVDLIEHLRIDDPIGAVAVHGGCGIWGTWAVGLFATGQYVDVEGLFWGGGVKQLWAQIWGNVADRHRRLRRRLHHLQGDQRRRHAADLRGGRARGHRHPRARRTRLPPGAGLHGRGSGVSADHTARRELSCKN